MPDIATPARPEERTLTVICGAGLCNRLKVLLSGRLIAAETGRKFKMLWPRNQYCGAAFQDLWEGGADVCDLPKEMQGNMPSCWHWSDPSFPDLLTVPDRDVVIRCVNFLLRPALYSAHAPLIPKCARMLNAMRPAVPIRETVARFVAERFRPTMIGVHVRRGDFLCDNPTKLSDVAEVLAATDRALRDLPAAGILLCTDDGAPWPEDDTLPRRRPEGIKEKFAARYGQRVVWHDPRELDRSKPASIQDALVDLLLLRKTDYIIGSKASTFSRMAAFGRRVPVVMCGSGDSKPG